MNRPVQDAINDYWTDRAPSYDDYQQRPERRDLDVEAWGRIWTDALPPAPADVLDVGTGSGHVACLLASLGHRVTGTDLSDGMLERARQHAAALPHPPRILRGDAVAPDFPDASFDVITGRYVLWTLRDPVAAVRAWIRVLRPGGVVAMADSTWFTDGLGSLYGERPDAALPLADARSINESAAALQAGGLVDVQVLPLTSVLELDLVHGVAPGHDAQLQFLVTGRAPDSASADPPRGSSSPSRPAVDDRTPGRERVTPMTTPAVPPHHPLDVPLGDVAAEDPAESVEHEAEATEALEATEGDVESDNDTPPEEPAVTTVTGMGPVTDGDDLTI